MNSDRADGLTAQAADPVATAFFGESMANTPLAIRVYPMVADLALRKGEAAIAQRLHGATQALRTAMRAQWRGDMFNRA